MLSEVRTIIGEVASEHGLPRALMLARWRRPDLVFARRALMHRLHDTGRTVSTIARLLGFDHSTVWHALYDPPRKPPWHKPLVKELRGKLLELYDAWPVQDLSFVVFPRRRRNSVGRDGTNVRAGKALRRRHELQSEQHRDHSPG